MPTNIAQLLSVVRILLEYGRHLAATIERRAAAPGFGLFAALFGSPRLPVIHAYLHRGILRAAALESLLRERAATGCDVAMSPLHTGSEADTDSAEAKPDPLHEPLGAQIARLAAERAAHDAPIDPAHLPTLEDMEAEIRDRPIGLTIAHIRRDLGIVAGLCTRAFWDSVTEAIACYEDSALKYSDDVQHKPEMFQRDQGDNLPSEQMRRQLARKDDLPSEQMRQQSAAEDDLPSDQTPQQATPGGELSSEQMQQQSAEDDLISEQMHPESTSEEDPPSEQMQASATAEDDPALKRSGPPCQHQSLSGNILQPPHVEVGNRTAPQHSVVQRDSRPGSHAPGFRLAHPPFDLLRQIPLPAARHHDVPVRKYRIAAAAKATGPPQRPAMKLAA